MSNNGYSDSYGHSYLRYLLSYLYWYVFLNGACCIVCMSVCKCVLEQAPRYQLLFTLVCILEWNMLHCLYIHEVLLYEMIISCTSPKSICTYSCINSPRIFTKKLVSKGCVLWCIEISYDLPMRKYRYFTSLMIIELRTSPK